MLDFGEHEAEAEAASGSTGLCEPCAFVRPPLVLGLGNVLLRDDGTGVRLTMSLQMAMGSHAATFIDGGTMSFSLLPYVEATDAMLVIDAADLREPPGTIGLYEGAEMDRFLRILRPRTVHEIGLIDLMDMARLQGCLPKQRALLCLQPDRIDWGEELSSSVAAALPEAQRRAAGLLQRWKSA